MLLVRGEYDGIATVADLEEFFNLLPNGDRQFVILPGTAHSVALATNRAIVLACDPVVPDDADADRDVSANDAIIPGRSVSCEPGILAIPDVQLSI